MDYTRIPISFKVADMNLEGLVDTVDPTAEALKFKRRWYYYGRGQRL